ITTPANLQPARAFLEQSPYPFSAPKPRLLVRDHHLAKMLRRGEIFIRCCGLLEGKHAINHRSKLVMLNGTIHLLKGGTTRNIDALQAQSRQDRSQWGCRGSKARQNTNERDLTTKGTGADRFLQGPTTPSLENMVDATAMSQGAHRDVPIRCLRVVHT